MRLVKAHAKEERRRAAAASLGLGRHSAEVCDLRYLKLQNKSDHFVMKNHRFSGAILHSF